MEVKWATGSHSSATGVKETVRCKSMLDISGKSESADTKPIQEDESANELMHRIEKLKAR